VIQAISVVGKRKTGKTTFALSAPKPMVLFDFELGVDRVEPKYVQDMDKVRVIPYVKEMLAVKGKKTATAQDLWQRILVDFSNAIEDKSVQTITFDTYSSVWEARRMAYLAELQKVDSSRKNLMPQEYFIPNTDMKMLITQAMIHNKILILVHHTRDKYVEGKPTGEEEADGFKYTGDLVEVEFWMGKRKDKAGVMKPYGTIEACRLCMAVEGQELAEPSYDLLDKLITARRGG